MNFKLIILIVSIVINLSICGDLTTSLPVARSFGINFSGNGITGHGFMNKTWSEYVICGLPIENIYSIMIIPRDPFLDLDQNLTTIVNYGYVVKNFGKLDFDVDGCYYRNSTWPNTFFGAGADENDEFGRYNGLYYAIVDETSGTTLVGGGYSTIVKEDLLEEDNTRDYWAATHFGGLSCVFKEKPGYENQIRGAMYFRQEGDALRVRYAVSGLPNGENPFHVHYFGTMDAGTTGGHFIGECNGCRPEGVLQEVAMLGNGTKLSAVNNFAAGDFIEETATIVGINGIVGRSIVIHHADHNGRIAQCIIAHTEFEQPKDVPVSTFFDNTGFTIEAFTAVLQPTTLAINESFGIFEVAEYGWVRYMMFGLTAGTDYTMHIHDTGSLCSNDGSHTGAHWVGSCTNCREGEATVGYVKDGAFLNVDPATGFASGLFYDPILFSIFTEGYTGDFYGAGRGIIVHEPTTGKRVLQGALGISKETESVSAPYNGNNVAVEAIVQIVGTTKNPDAYGFATFSFNGSHTQVDYAFGGLEQGEHGWHVHQTGDVLDYNNAKSVGGHFIGSAPNRTGSVDEVGLINDGIKIVVDINGRSTGSFVDEYLRFQGQDGILGRSIIIHGIDSANRVGMGVIALAKSEHTSISECYSPPSFLIQATPVPTQKPTGESSSSSSSSVTGTGEPATGPTGATPRPSTTSSATTLTISFVITLLSIVVSFF